MLLKKYCCCKAGSGPQEKKRLSHLWHLLPQQTQIRIHILLLWCWQNLPQVIIQLQTELSFRCQPWKLSYPASSAEWGLGWEWEPGQDGFLLWQFSMLCLATLNLRDTIFIPLALTYHSHKTTLRMSKKLVIAKEEKRPKTWIWILSKVLTRKSYLFPSPLEMSLGAVTYLLLPARALEAKFRQIISSGWANDTWLVLEMT